MPGRAVRWSRRFITFAAAAAVTLYFGAVFIHVGPLNPAKLQYGDRAADVLVPYFDQNWSLFAPDPISTERGVLVRARNVDTGVVTEWLDITTQANSDARSRVMFSPRTSRIISNGLAMYLSPDPYRALLLDKAEENDVEVDDAAYELTDEEIEYQRNAVSMMSRHASTVALDRWGSDIDELQLRIVVHEFPAFSQRADWRDVGDVQTQDLPWVEVTRGVGR